MERQRRADLQKWAENKLSEPAAWFTLHRDIREYEKGAQSEIPDLCAELTLPRAGTVDGGAIHSRHLRRL